MFRSAAVLVFVVLVFGTTPNADAADSSLAVNIDLIAPASGEAILPGDPFTIRLSLTDPTQSPPEDLVVVISSPHLPTRMVPLDANPGSTEASADVDIDAPFFEDSASDRRRLPLTFRIAHRTGQRLVTRATRTFQLTVTIPRESDHQPAGPASDAPRTLALTDAPTADPVGVLDPPLKALAVAPARIEEQSLLPSHSAKPSPAYWERVKGRITERISEHTFTSTGTMPGRTPTLHFRLFANGSAQSIRLDPGTGNAAMDQLILQSVVDAQPFPPFPPDVADPHLDVHLAMPPLPTRTE
ncbi:hypothetical protein YTPLAS18_29750 [Nitrospira sp.]|nr:hypothetical protein YTPLAS18_29750 [Nitrospira sp.]